MNRPFLKNLYCFVGSVLLVSFMTSCTKKKDDGIVSNDVVDSIAQTNIVAIVDDIVKEDIVEEPEEKIQDLVITSINVEGGENVGRCIVEFSHNIDINEIKDYIEISPKVELSYSKSYWRNNDIILTGKFEPSKEYKITIHKGVFTSTTFEKYRVDRKVQLKYDYYRTFIAADYRPLLTLVSPGRYLPSLNKGRVKISHINVSEVSCELVEIPEENIVQMVAREFSVYDRYYSRGVREDVKELGWNITSWKEKLNNEKNKQGETWIDFYKHINSNDTKKGVYALFLKSDNMEIIRLFCVTDIGVSVEMAKDNAQVWLTSLVDGSSIKNANIKLFAANNKVVGSGTTDDNGIAQINLINDKDKPFVVIVDEEGKDFTFMPLNYSTVAMNKGVVYRNEYIKDRGMEAFVWTDRGIYRHGEKIMIGAVVKKDDGKSPMPMPLELSVYSPSMNLYKKIPIMSDELGGVYYSDLIIPEDQRSGDWLIRLSYVGGEKIGEAKIRVEEFVPPQIRVESKSSKASYKKNEKMEFETTSSHLFGNPASGLILKGDLYLKLSDFTSPKHKGYVFGDKNRTLNYYYKQIGSTKLDDSGHGAFEYLLEGNLLPPSAINVTYVGTVLEAGGRGVISKVTTTYHPYPFYVGAKIYEDGESFIRPQSERKMKLVALDVDKNYLTRDVEVDVKIDRVNWVYGYVKNDDGTYTWKSDKISTIVKEVKCVIASGKIVEIDLPSDVEGSYEVRISSEQNVSTFTSYSVLDYGSDEMSISLSKPNRLYLKTDKVSYAHGDVPKLQIKSPITGVGYLTISHKDIYHTELVSITNKNMVVELPSIDKKFFPNVRVKLSVVQPLSTKKSNISQKAFGEIDFAVNDLSRKLEVEANGFVELTESGSKIRVPIKVINNGGKKCRAIVTVVDEGINMLCSKFEQNPFAFFSLFRNNRYRSYDMYRSLVPVDDDVLKSSGIKIGGDTIGDLIGRLSPINSRRFKPLSKFTQSKIFDNGEDVVEFLLPEFSGEVRVNVVVYSEDAVGSNSVLCKIKPGLVLKADAPRFVAPKDITYLTMSLHNTTTNSGEVVASINVADEKGNVWLIKNKTLSLSSGSSTNLEYQLDVRDYVGECNITYIAEGLGEKHSDVIKLPVRPASPRETKTTVEKLNSGENLKVQKNKAYIPETSSIDVSIQTSALSVLIPALEYVTYYPYGCVEQTSSSVFPLLMSSGVLSKLPVDRTSMKEDASSLVRIAIDRVLSMQRHKLGYAMWPTSKEVTTDFISVYVCHFIVEAYKANYDISKTMYENNIDILRRIAYSANKDNSAYALYVMALAGKIDINAMLNMYYRMDEMSSQAKCSLARAFVIYGDLAKANKLLEHNIDLSSTFSIASSLLAFLDVNPDNENVLMLVNKLLDRRNEEDGHWESTIENSFALQALSKYYRFSDEGDGVPNVVCKIDGENGVALPIGEIINLNLSDSGCELVNNGDTCYIRITEKGVPQELTDDAFDKSIKVRKSFYDLKGNLLDINGIKRGDSVVVCIDVTSMNESLSYENIVIEDLLPACFEVENLHNLKGEANLIGDVKHNMSEWCEHQESRDDRVLFFSKSSSYIKMPWTACYTVRVVGKGEYVVPATLAEAMYDSEIASRDTVKKIVIKE